MLYHNQLNFYILILSVVHDQKSLCKNITSCH